MLKQRSRVIYSLLFFISLPILAWGQKPYLSNLHATDNSPLYTTYAAQMARSEFALDEGYHFMFYKPDRGIQFHTDTAGDLMLGFQKDGKFVYKLKDMYRKPVITTSYTDIVKYHYEPFKNIRIDATFLVYSSHMALWDLNITNSGKKASKIKVFAILRNNYRTFDKIEKRTNQNAILFSHKELPDGWVTGHHIPFVDKVKDVLLFSKKPDAVHSYHSFHEGTFSIPHQVDLEKKAEHLVTGKITNNNDQTCRMGAPKAGLMAFINEDKSKILTETAPRWGSSERNITGYGNWGIDLGNFDHLQKKSSFTIRMRCGDQNYLAETKGSITDFKNRNQLQRNLKLKKSDLPPVPANLRITPESGKTSINLHWDSSGSNLTYNIYRRTYKEQGYYKRVAQGIRSNSYTDHNIDPRKIYGYIVTASGKRDYMSMPSNEVNSVSRSSFITDTESGNQHQQNSVSSLAKVISASKTLHLNPGVSQHVRLIRGVARPDKDNETLIGDASQLVDKPLEPFIKANEKLYSQIPRIEFNDPDKAMLYWSSFTLMRQVMLPPEGQLNHNYYVFSREPTWGWGHGGQVFHESLTMLAYAFMDPKSAMNSQLVYEQVQDEDGYINYRTGSYLNEKIKVDGQNTTSAPWYAWQNWMVYKVTRDKDFLKKMYQSSKKFYNYYVTTRDSDGDGLCEWGGHAVLESVRDAQVAVWDKVGWPTNFDAVDLNTMLVSEAKALGNMADELGLTEEAKEWRRDAHKRTHLINDTMWDDETGFYYQVDKNDNDFTFKKPNDLKREEIIGFLPLWAGVATKEQAKQLVQKLTDPDKFWRKYGIPSLAADDSYFNPKGYWNGPVWVEWNYLIENGLLKYGYHSIAQKLVDKVSENMISQLKEDHTLWEFYSPDSKWGGYHQTYIWAGIITRMMMDVRNQNLTNTN